MKRRGQTEFKISSKTWTILSLPIYPIRGPPFLIFIRWRCLPFLMVIPSPPCSPTSPSSLRWSLSWKRRKLTSPTPTKIQEIVKKSLVYQKRLCRHVKGRFRSWTSNHLKWQYQSLDWFFLLPSWMILCHSFPSTFYVSSICFYSLIGEKLRLEIF